MSSPKTFETFRPIAAFEIGNLTQDEPSCFNGIVKIRRYRVTVEEIEEPTEVLAERLRKLWRQCDNHHNWGPLQASAKSIGIELDNDEWGKDRKRG